MNNFTVDNIIDVLADFLEPVAGTCVQAQANRVPMPKGQFCVLTPLRFTRLSSTKEMPGDTGDASTSTMSYAEVRQADIQVDFYGDNAGDRAVAVETLFASDYAWSKIKSLDARLSPLYSSPAIQAPMINAEDQWEERYLLTLSLQAHITVSLSQDYFDKAEILTDMVDN
ncbi:phage neck terminator protein [Escherichia coli]|uniref:phage neck terminator protein n=1 Tax=Escherichia coli TaxID=562 RepID=UPI001FCE7F7E|nr:hypothetical protein [Escherichia coli]